MGLGLNLGAVKREEPLDEKKESQARPMGAPSMNLGGLKKPDVEMQDESKPKVPPMKLGGVGGGKIPALSLGNVPRDPDP